MFINQLTSSFAFNELYFGEKLFTALSATKEKDHYFCMIRLIGIFFMYIEFAHNYLPVFRISFLGFPHHNEVQSVLFENHQDNLPLPNHRVEKNNFNSILLCLRSINLFPNTSCSFCALVPI